MRILIDQTLPHIAEAFPKPFIITKYSSNDKVADLLIEQDILLCRSTLKVNKALLQNSQLKYVVTASSGTDHINKNYLQTQNIQLIDAKGSNAIAVADYVLASIACLYQQEISTGRTAGIIGFGMVGKKVYTYLKKLGYQIKIYDPLLAVRDENFISCNLSDLMACSLLCIHAELHDTLPYPSRDLIDANFLNQLQANTVIINAARGGIVNETALLNTDNNLIYCTDVYLNEPNVNPKIINFAKLCTPHIAGHSLEAKTTALTMVSEKLHKILGLKNPTFNLIISGEILFNIDIDVWQYQILTFYNPHIETQAFKMADCKKNAFLNLRLAHNKRHDFWTYNI